MSMYRFYSPQSPLPEDRGLSGLEVHLERKNRLLQSAERNYNEAVSAYAIQQQHSDMADNRRSSIRRKRKISCNGCTKKWCNECCLAGANKRLREAGDLVEEIKSDIEAIKSRMVPQQIARQVIPPCPVPAFVDSDDENDSNDEVKQEADVKQEPEDSYSSIPIQFSIGIMNTVKSEPMERSNEHQNQTTEDSDTSNATSNESSNGTIQEESTLRSEQSFRDYPTTPEQSNDYSTSEDDSDNDTEDENEDRRPIRSILNLLNE